MHPVIRISCFLLFCIALVRPDSEQLMLAGLCLAGLIPWLTFPQWRRAFAMVRRLRWLLLSILVIYGWFTPGQLLDIPFPDSLRPTYEGLEAGLFRIASLILILVAAGILLASTSREQLIAGLYWLLEPLRIFHLPVERLAVRLVLTLDYVERQASQWRAPAATGQEAISGRINRIARHLAGVLPRLFSQAEQQSVAVIRLDVPPAPALIEWGWPILLIAGFVAGGYIQF